MDIGFAEAISTRQLRSVCRSVVRACNGSRQLEQIVLPVPDGERATRTLLDLLEIGVEWRCLGMYLP